MPRLIAAFVALLLALSASPAAASALSDGGGVLKDERFTELGPIVEAAGAAGLRTFAGIAVVEERIDRTGEVLATYERDREPLESEADARSGTSAMIRKVASSDWVCPVDGEMEFRDSWGEPRSNGRKHDGVDIVAQSRTPLLAPEAGMVTFRWDMIGGRSFDLVTADGDYYFGTHLRSYGTEGDVDAGEVIGYVGRTGNAVGSHLHFEYHPGGKGNSVNPFFLIDTHCR